MEQVKLGRSGLSVSIAGLGCGGASRLGRASGKSEAHSIRIVHAALDAGVTLVDTAAGYGTEGIVGKALADRREGVVLSTKVPITEPLSTSTDGALISARELRSRVDASLAKLRTDRLDILFLHGVTARQYDGARDRLVPELEALRQAGKIRAIGVTERFAKDTGHVMLQRAIRDDCWDVVMVGFSLLNQSARTSVLPTTMAKGIATLCMSAVRRAISQPDELRRVVGRLLETGEIDSGAVDAVDPLGFLTRSGGAASIVEAAYRYCRHEPGMDAVLTGTGDLSHLSNNIRAIQGPPLDPDSVRRLLDLFGRLDMVSGN